jgi:hypothetical protein
MNTKLDISRIAAAVQLLETTKPGDRFDALRDLALSNGGRCDLPGEARGDDGDPLYDPILKSIEVFGIYAMADTIDELPQNWMLCARNVLSGGFDRAEVA